MTALAVNVLWFLIGLIILCGIVWLAIWVIESFIMPIPEPIKKGVWVIVLLLALIALIGAVAGGGFHFPSIRGDTGGTSPTISALTAIDMYRLLK
jgi:hypothetical protein